MSSSYGSSPQDLPRDPRPHSGGEPRADVLTCVSSTQVPLPTHFCKCQLGNDLHPHPYHHSGVKKGELTGGQPTWKPPKPVSPSLIINLGQVCSPLTSTLALPMGRKPLTIDYRTSGLMKDSPFRPTPSIIPSPGPAFSGLQSSGS